MIRFKQIVPLFEWEHVAIQEIGMPYTVRCVYLIHEILSVAFVLPHLQQPLSSSIQTILSHITSSPIQRLPRNVCSLTN